MGLIYDETPPEKWIEAKVFAEYAVSLVNRFTAQHQTSEIPLPIARSFAGNLLRAAEFLPAESKSSSKYKDAYNDLITHTKPLLTSTKTVGH
jgi:hypothetical protein